MVKWENWETLKPKKEETVGNLDSPSDIENNVEQEKYSQNILRAFNRVGLPLDYGLDYVLSEGDEQQGGRKGCGFTQGSRILAESVNHKSSEKKLIHFFDTSKIDDMLFQKGGWDLMDEFDKSQLITKEAFEEILNALDSESHKKFVYMIMDLCDLREIDHRIPKLSVSENLDKVGTCTTAEAYFYDYLNPQPFWCIGLRWSDSQNLNVVIDENEEPIFFEKSGIGEKTALTLKPFVLNGFEIPAGSLVQLDYDKISLQTKTRDEKGYKISLDDITGAKFLRFTPLMSDPEERKKVFTSQIDHQIQNGMYNAENITIEDFVTKIYSHIN